MANDKIIPYKLALQTGLTYYFTGKVCVNGHIALRRVSNRSCKICDAERAQKLGLRYRSKPGMKAVLSARHKKWNAQRKWTEEQRIKARAATTKWRKKNLEKARAYGREYAAKNVERRRINNKEYSRKNAAKLAAKERNKRAIRLRNGGTHTKEDVADILKMQRGKCAYCRLKLGKKYHVDHIVPSVKGGSNGRENLQILCALCNHKKHARDPVEFAQSLGFLL